jgi:putative nucleotidyltransferase with HDIG domain
MVQEQNPKHTLNLDTIRREIQAMDTFKSPPYLLQEILTVTEDPNSGAKDVQAMVERDMSCSVKLLKLANSAYYGFSRQIRTVREAIVIIGLDGVKNVVMSLGIADAFTKGTAEEKAFLNNLWVHSMATATAASLLVKSIPGISNSVGYCSGLLHDFGKVILSQYFGPRYERLVTSAREGKQSLHSIEKKILQVDHMTIGYWIAEAWDLPEMVSDIMHEHHSIGPWSPTQLHVPLVSLANTLAYESRVGHGGNYRSRSSDDYVYAGLGIDSAMLASVIAEIHKESTRFAAMLHLE